VRSPKVPGGEEEEEEAEAPWDGADIPGDGMTEDHWQKRKVHLHSPVGRTHRPADHDGKKQGRCPGFRRLVEERKPATPDDTSRRERLRFAGAPFRAHLGTRVVV
jgi:hypothetical protein